jgi:adenylate cyclase
MQYYLSGKLGLALETARPQRRLSAILAADIVGYARLVGLDEEGTVRRWQVHQAEVVFPRVSKFGGRVVKSLGDGLLVEFASAVDAVRSAAEIQEALSSAEAKFDVAQRIQLRIGINIGDVIIDGADIQGDGVNIAARLQAEAAPNGILVSRGVRDAVAGKADISFTDRGEVRLKNVARPVRVFALKAPETSMRTRALAPWRWVSMRRRPALMIAGLAVLVGVSAWAVVTQTSLRTSNQASPPHIADGASIAVLPFTNSSGDSAQDYFADGITEDIIASLGKFSQLVVIARNTTFRYKGKAVDVRAIGRELGVRYVLEGSVRRDQERVRVTAQLIDTNSGGHVWSDRYDRKPEDIFAVQDEITEGIVVTLVAAVSRAEIERARRKAPATLAAYENYLRGVELLRARFTRPPWGKTILESRAFLELAIAQDSNFSLAYSALADNYISAWIEPPEYAPLQHEYQNAATLEKALYHARKVVEVDPGSSEGYAKMGWVLHWMRRPEEAQSAYQRALAVNPNLIDDAYPNALIKFGRPGESVKFLERQIRIDPSFGRNYGTLGLAHYMLRNYTRSDEALVACKRYAPLWRACSVWRAATLAQLSRTDEAKMEAAAVKRFDANFTISAWIGFEPFARHEDAEHLADGLRKAGLPE